MKAIHRLFEYFEYKNIKPTRFEKDFGLSNGYLGVQLKREADIGSSILETIIDNCIDLDITWLITGRGHMLTNGFKVELIKNDEGIVLTDMDSSTDCISCKNKDKLILKLQRELDLQKNWSTAWLK